MNLTINALAGRLVCYAVKTVSIAALLLVTGTYARADGGVENQFPIVVNNFGHLPLCVTQTILGVFNTIQAAINYAPAGSLILVCPGTYPELVTINKSLTLRGVTNLAGNAGAPVITLPNGGSGVAANYSTDGLFSISGYAPAVAQVLVKATNVTIANLAVDASNTYTNCSAPSLIGIVFTTGSSGSVKGAAVRNPAVVDQATNNPFAVVGTYCSTEDLSGAPLGIGILADQTAGAVSILNSSLRGFDFAGIRLETPGPVTVDGNTVVGIPSAQGANCVNIVLGGVGGGHVNNNTVTSCSAGGILAEGAQRALAISGNTISTATPIVVNAGQGGAVGIASFSNSAAVTISYNTIAAPLGVASDYGSGIPTYPGATIQNNDISGAMVGIGLSPYSGTTVSGNTVNDATYGVVGVTGNTVSGNTYLNVTALTQ